jgi:hypothetical protein
MSRIWPLLIILCIGAPEKGTGPVILEVLSPFPARADDKPPGDKLAAIQKEYKDAEAAYRKAGDDLPDTPEGQKKAEELWKAYDKKQSELFQKAVDLAKADPKSDAAFTALEWVLTNPRALQLPAGKAGLELAAEHHATNPKIGKIIAWVGYYPPHEAEKHDAAFALIKAVAEKNRDRTARGQAVMALAWEAKRKFATAEHKKAKDVEERAADAEKAFEAVLKDYADCPRLIKEDAGTLGDRAKEELFDLRHLRIGKTAPDIEGGDLDGVSFKLSDYRGKVVVLDFWGDW